MSYPQYEGVTYSLEFGGLVGVECSDGISLLVQSLGHVTKDGLVGLAAVRGAQNRYTDA